MRLTLPIYAALTLAICGGCYEPPPQEEPPPMWYYHNGPTNSHHYDIAAAAPNDVWAVGESDQGQAEIIRYVTYGWQIVSLPEGLTAPLYAVAVAPGGDVWVAGAGADIYQWDGYSWRAWPRPSPQSPIYGLAMPRDDRGWAVGAHGRIWCFEGTAWTEVPSPAAADLRRVRALSSVSAWAVGDHGAVLHYDGSGWAAVSFPPSVDARDAFFAAEDDGWVVGSLASLYHWDGVAFKKYASPDADIFYRCCGFASNRLGWAGGDQMRVARYEDGVWGIEENLPSGHWNLNCIYFVSESEGWAMGDNGFILHYH